MRKLGVSNRVLDVFGIARRKGKSLFAESRGAERRIGMPVFIPSRRKFLVYCAASSRSIFSRSRSVTSRRNREFSSSSLAIRSSPLPDRLRPSASLRHRCKVTTLTPSVRAISLCSFPCLAKSFACASFVATSTLECRFGLTIACPAAVTSISFTEQPRQLQFFGQACAFVDKVSDKPALRSAR